MTEVKNMEFDAAIADKLKNGKVGSWCQENKLKCEQDGPPATSQCATEGLPYLAAPSTPTGPGNQPPYCQLQDMIVRLFIISLLT